MIITPISVGQMATNCYLATDEDSKNTIIIDPGEDADFISETILKNSFIPVAIVLTHGHYDHCLAALELILNFKIPIYLHQDDLSIYQRAKRTADHFSTSKNLDIPPVSKFLKDKQILRFGNSQMTVIHTPGHTPGSVCLHSEEVLFTGDTLFSDSVGDTSHQYSNPKHLKNSLSIIKKLPSHTIIYPGHGNSAFLSDLKPLFL